MTIRRSRDSTPNTAPNARASCGRSIRAQAGSTKSSPDVGPRSPSASKINRRASAASHPRRIAASAQRWAAASPTSRGVISGTAGAASIAS
jgi:hypothetical protein